MCAVGAIGRNAIGPRQHRGGEIGDGRRVRAHIAALIVENFVVDREDAALAIDRGAHVMLLLARMVGGDEMFAAVLDPFDRAAQAQRSGAHQHVFRIKFAANAEAAADMALDRAAREARPRPSMRAIWSRFQCGTLAAPCSSSTSRAAS